MTPPPPLQPPGLQTPAQQPGQYHPEIIAFREYIAGGLGEHAHNGINGRGEEEAFVCREALVKYWTWDKINAVLKRDGNDKEAYRDDIETNYLVVFSILCYIYRSAFITNFTRIQCNDAALARFHLNLPWSDDDVLRLVWDEFCEAQWKFNPVVFDNITHQRDLVPEAIVPLVCDTKPLAGQVDDEAVIYKASVYACCLGPKRKSAAKSNELVLKMLGPNKLEFELWEKETGAYSIINASSQPAAPPSNRIPESATKPSVFDYIPTYLGSFKRIPRQGNPSQNPLQPSQTPRTPPNSAAVTNRHLVERTHVIMLEYAQGGSLVNFCNQHLGLIMSPKKQDRLNLWYHLFHLLQALWIIHRLDGTHQDIKESNILSMYSDPVCLGNRDKPCFKLADFGKSHFKTHPDSKDVNSYGNRTYMAPESSAINSVEHISDDTRRPYTQAADVWGIGCLFSEMLVRCKLGQDGVDRYRQARINENTKREGVYKGFEPRCFHDGTSRLKCVDVFHDEALQEPSCDPAGDEVLRAVSEIVLKRMLLQYGARPDDVLGIRTEWVGLVQPGPSGRLSMARLEEPPRATDVEVPSQPRAGTPPPSHIPPRLPPPPPPPDFVQPSAPVPIFNPPTMGSVVSLQPRRGTATMPVLHPSITVSARSLQPTHGAFTVPGVVKLLQERLLQAKFTRKPTTQILENNFQIRKTLNGIEGRQHYFLVDGSHSMAGFRKEVANTIWVLTRLLKSRVEDRDRNNVRMSLTNKPGIVYSLKKYDSSKLGDVVREHSFDNPDEGSGYPIGQWFGNLTDEIANTASKKGRPPPVSFYILTDGAFGTELPDFATHAQALVLHLREQRQYVSPTFLLVIIIQFGETPRADLALSDIQQSMAGWGDEQLPLASNPIHIFHWDDNIADIFTRGIREGSTRASINTSVRPGRARDNRASVMHSG